MNGPIIFSVSQIHRPHIYEAAGFTEEERPRFGASILANEAPDVFREHMGDPRWIESLDTSVYTLSSLHRPAVITDKPISTILSCTDAANLPRDRLFSNLKMDVAVVLYDLEDRTRSKPPRRRAALQAVRVRWADLAKRYDEVCAEFFADPSLPYRGPPIR